MPIRINLLAEVQSAEEMRRRDPVKRTIFGGSAVVVAVLAWIIVAQVQIMASKGKLNRLEAEMETKSESFNQVMESVNEVAETKGKLGKLTLLATNRFLNGTMLNALRQTTVPDVQLLRMKLAQSYVLADEVKPKTNATGRVSPGKPATSTEKILLTLEAKDSSASPGNEQVNKYKETLSKYPFFAEALARTNEFRLINLAPPQATESGRASVLFTLECRFPEIVR